MDLRKLKTLIELVQESGIAELEVTEGEEKVRITRTVANTVPPMMHYAAPMMGRCLAPAVAPRQPQRQRSPRPPPQHRRHQPSRWPPGQIADGWHFLHRHHRPAPNRLSKWAARSPLATPLHHRGHEAR